LSSARAGAASSAAPNAAASSENLDIIKGPPVRPSHWPICDCFISKVRRR
jgi:hypothetical protein